MFGPIQRQHELRFSLAGLGLSGNTQSGTRKVGRGYQVKEGVNRGNGTDPLNSWKGKCPQTQWGKNGGEEREREIRRWATSKSITCFENICGITRIDFPRRVSVVEVNGTGQALSLYYKILGLNLIRRDHSFCFLSKNVKTYRSLILPVVLYGSKETEWWHSRAGCWEYLELRQRKCRRLRKILSWRMVKKKGEVVHVLT